MNKANWDLLGKWDVIFGIAGGIALFFSGLRWIAKHAKLRPFTRFISWSVLGDYDEQMLTITIKGIVKLIGASIIWAVLGALIASTILLALTLLATILGSHTSGTLQALIQYASLGAFIGALFRGIIWPALGLLLCAFRARAITQAKRLQAFNQQKERVQSRLHREETE